MTDVPVDLVGGRYRVVGRLGEGGMGVVWEARDERAGDEVVIKTMPEGAAADLDALGRFVREAKLALPLEHPNVIRTLALVTEGPRAPAIVLERLRGETLADRLARGLATGPEAARIGVALLGALGAVHAAGIVHRDVKPSNVFLCEGSSPPVPKLIDFGIARGLGAALTRTGVIVGTPEYMAPELLGGATVDPRADVYAVGATMYEALAGRTPFEDEGVRLMKAIVVDEIPPLDSLRPDLDAELVAIVHRALAKNPALRFATAGEMRDRLAAWLAIVDAAATHEARRASPPTLSQWREPARDGRETGRSQARRSTPRALWLFPFAALAGAIGVGALAARLSAPSRAPAPPPASAPVRAVDEAPIEALPSAPPVTPSSASAAPSAASARVSGGDAGAKGKRALPPRYTVVGQTLVDAPPDEHRALDREISAYARAHLGFEACVPLDPPDCNDVVTVHLTGGDYAQGHYGGKDCHTPEFHTCVVGATRQHPFVTATRGTKWTATLSLLRLVEDPTSGPPKRVSP